MENHPGGEKDGWVEVFRSRTAGPCRERSLVLTALGIEHSMEAEDGVWFLWTPAAVGILANQHLLAYERENVDWPPPRDLPGLRPVGLEGVLGYWTVLGSVFAFERRWVFGFDWSEQGKAHAELISAGQWWRTLTALTLHADEAHLLGNLVFGALFGVLLSQELGVGVGWLLVVVAGALGNGLNAALKPAYHISVGASTGVFGAMGALMALQWRQRWRGGGWWRWAPLVAGAVFLGFLGTAGQRTDVLAHVTGTLCGVVLGILVAPLRSEGRLPFWLQGVAAVVAVGLLAGSWAVALGVVPKTWNLD